MPKILFLCTGNYYRSRFSEELFNHLAGSRGLPWLAESRALAIERGKDNIGPVAPLVLDALRKRGVVPRRADRSPLRCSELDFEGADLVIALSDAEHRELVLDTFPEWEFHVEYWNVSDINVAPADVTFATIERNMNTLIERLVAGERPTGER